MLNFIHKFVQMALETAKFVTKKIWLIAYLVFLDILLMLQMLHKHIVSPAHKAARNVLMVKILLAFCAMKAIGLMECPD